MRIKKHTVDVDYKLNKELKRIIDSFNSSSKNIKAVVTSASRGIDYVNLEEGWFIYKNIYGKIFPQIPGGGIKNIYDILINRDTDLGKVTGMAERAIKNAGCAKGDLYTRDILEPNVFYFHETHKSWDKVCRNGSQIVNL